MSQIRNLGFTITLGTNIIEIDLGMTERVVNNDIQFTPKIETQDLVIPIVGALPSYLFDTTLVRWDTTLITFDYE